MRTGEVQVGSGQFREFCGLQRDSAETTRAEAIRLPKAVKLAGLYTGAGVLDVGMRLGALHDYIEKQVKGIRYEGAEVSEDRARRTRQKGLTLHCLDITNVTPWVESFA